MLDGWGWPERGGSWGGGGGERVRRDEGKREKVVGEGGFGDREI